MITKLYTLFLGLLLAVFVGVGIAAFYHAPKAPEYPTISRTEPNAATTPAEDRRFQEDSERYNTVRQGYDRNVSLLALGAAVTLVLLGLTLLRNIDIMGDSVLLGGILTLAYSTIRGFGTDDISRFLIVSGGLAIAITVGYLKFIRPSQLKISDKK